MLVLGFFCQAGLSAALSGRAFGVYSASGLLCHNDGSRRICPDARPRNDEADDRSAQITHL